jgi:hypothetical protein
MFLGLGFSFLKNGAQMFSPGDLTHKRLPGVNLGGFASHGDFESECERCHAPLVTNQADLCVRCHTTVLDQIVSQAGTHSKLPNIQECRSCHPDHKGRDFDPIAPAYALYDHSLADFSLLWHQVDYDKTPMNCLDCHVTENGFELETGSCQDCHAGHDKKFMTEHIQDYGEDCLVCHDGSGEIANFDHSTTDFPLEGTHLQVQCADCHANGTFTGVSQRCVDCHAEPDLHFGLFSQDCAACHTAAGWSALVSLDGRVFDHFDDAGFSLSRHLSDYSSDSVHCSGCHTSGDGFTVSFELAFCAECHAQEDPAFMEEHQRQFGQDCLACHDGIDRMSDFDHDRFFILDGKHAEVSCENCHLDQVFSDTPSLCMDCHEEPEIHRGYFGLQCENCHETSAWSPAKMSDHDFPLDHGESGLVACEVCHNTRYTEYTCYGCHEHQPGEILEEHLDEGISQAELVDCIACHPNGFKDED